jgi:hypothetical protein
MTRSRKIMSGKLAPMVCGKNLDGYMTAKAKIKPDDLCAGKPALAKAS